MGLDIKRNKNGLYKAKSSISDESVSEDWVTEDEFKKILIDRAYWKFIQETIKIDMEFPCGYYVNDRVEDFIEGKACAGSDWLIKNWGTDAVEIRYREICERLKIEL